MSEFWTSYNMIAHGQKLLEKFEKFFTIFTSCKDSKN